MTPKENGPRIIKLNGRAIGEVYPDEHEHVTGKKSFGYLVYAQDFGADMCDSAQQAEKCLIEDHLDFVRQLKEDFRRLCKELRYVGIDPQYCIAKPNKKRGKK